MVLPLFPAQAIPRWSDGERFVLYNPVTGGTHLVDEVAMLILDELNTSPLEKAALEQKILAAFDVPDESVRRHIELVIEQLCGFGFLIESC